MKDLTKTVALLCPLCGNDQFIFSDENDNSCDFSNAVSMRCSDCGPVFAKQELLDANKEIIDNAMHEMTQDVAKEITKEFKKVTIKWKI